MAEAYNQNFKPFGLNVRVPERTMQQAGESISKVATGAVDPLFKYLEENEEVFNGDVGMEINSIVAQSFNTGVLLRHADEEVNGKPSFDMHM